MGRQITASVEDADEWRELSVDADGRTAVLVDVDEGPNARIVKLEPRQELEAHFHTQNQWQIIVEGDGRIGDEAVQAVAVHYTEKNTPYGPIVAGDDGLTFLTLREKPTGYHPVNR